MRALNAALKALEEKKPEIAPGRHITPAREQSLFDCMTATWETISAQYFRCGYPSTREILDAEDRISEIQQAVLRGEAKLADFREAVLAWEAVVVEALEREGIMKY